MSGCVVWTCLQVLASFCKILNVVDLQKDNSIVPLNHMAQVSQVKSRSDLQKVACLHAVQLGNILEKLAAGIVLEHVLALFILVGFLADCWMHTIVLS